MSVIYSETIISTTNILPLLIQIFYIFIGTIFGVIIYTSVFLLTDLQGIAILIGISYQIIVYFVGLFIPTRLSIVSPIRLYLIDPNA